MRKSTKIKLDIEQKRNDVLQEQTEIEKEKNKIEKDRLFFEKETKDRADISLKEYEELKRKNKELEETFAILKKILKPFETAKVRYDLIEKMFNGNFNTRVETFQDSRSLKTKLYLIFEIDDRDLL